jgi:hypothetical protein
MSSPDEWSDIRGFFLGAYPAYRSAHAGYGLRNWGTTTRHGQSDWKKPSQSKTRK